MKLFKGRNTYNSNNAHSSILDSGRASTATAKNLHHPDSVKHLNIITKNESEVQSDVNVIHPFDQNGKFDFDIYV